jgi:hypothetical protein
MNAIPRFISNDFFNACLGLEICLAADPDNRAGGRPHPISAPTDSAPLSFRPLATVDCIPPGRESLSGENGARLSFVTIRRR